MVKSGQKWSKILQQVGHLQPADSPQLNHLPPQVLVKLGLEVVRVVLVGNPDCRRCTTDPAVNLLSKVCLPLSSGADHPELLDHRLLLPLPPLHLVQYPPLLLGKQPSRGPSLAMLLTKAGHQLFQVHGGDLVPEELLDGLPQGVAGASHLEYLNILTF